MSFQERAERTIEHYKQARAALKEIVHQEKIKVQIGDIGYHRAIWVSWKDSKDKEVTRQFSWSSREPSREQARMNWIYDNFMEYAKLKQELGMERRLNE